MAGTETSYEHLGSLEKQRRFPYMMDSLKRITEEAERLSVQIGLEPVAFHPLEDMETAVEVLDEIGSKRLQLIFDPANLLQRPEEVRQEAYWKRCLALGGACPFPRMGEGKAGACGYPGRAGFGLCACGYRLFAEDEGSELNIPFKKLSEKAFKLTGFGAGKE